MLAHGLHQVGKEKQARNVVPVGDIEVIALGMSINAPDFVGQVRKIGRPE